MARLKLFIHRRLIAIILDIPVKYRMNITETWTDRQWSIEAFNKALFAHSHVGTLNSKLVAAEARIDDLEGEIKELREIVMMLAEMIEGR